MQYYLLHGILYRVCNRTIPKINQRCFSMLYDVSSWDNGRKIWIENSDDDFTEQDLMNNGLDVTSLVEFLQNKV